MTLSRLILWLSISIGWLKGAAPVQGATQTLNGTVMCGYQGWFAAQGDGMDIGWQHYGFRKDGECHIDLWPDLTGFGEHELFTTPLKFPDGNPAQVFSSAHPDTVKRHFEWMREHGIDGVFLQRFGVSVRTGNRPSLVDTVLGNVRAAAAGTGRTWAVMYDLSGLKAGEIASRVIPDWRKLREELKVTSDPGYQHHAGKPVVAVWGIGFNDGRSYSLAETAELLRFLRVEVGGATVMAGVPFGWRTLDRDAVKDPELLEVLAGQVDIISPWAVGRYGTVEGAKKDIARVHRGDADWCHERGKSYLPVIFPGFSWYNLMKSRGQEARLNSIPRQQGRFYWQQAVERIRGGSEMLYVAMFDEMDEGTAIFKCSNTVPAGPSQFATYEGLPSDHYLWLTGQIGKALRAGPPMGEALPERQK